MKRPATSGGRRKAPAKAPARASRAKAEPQIKVTRNSPRPQIKASRGPGGPAKRRDVAPSPRGRKRTSPRGVAEADRRVAETRRQSLSSIGQASPRGGGSRRSAPRPTGGGVRAVSVGAGGAAAAARVVQEVARPVGAVTRPVLRVVSGGLEAIPNAAGRATPVSRGRLLIMLVGVLAAGLIYINVGKLEYGDGYAKYAARSLELQRENTVLRSRIANLNSAERIQHYAEGKGMYVPAPQQYTYLRPRRSDATKARGYSAPLMHAVPGGGGASAATGASDATATVPADTTTTDTSAMTGTGQ